jgi:hypothetical protein
MQKAVIVRYRYREERRDYALKQLHEYLDDGWRVVDMTTMGAVPAMSAEGNGPRAVFTALVVLEK